MRFQRLLWCALLGMILTLWAGTNSQAYDRFGVLRFAPHISTQEFGAGAIQGAQIGVDALFGNPANLSTLRFTEMKTDLGLFAEQSWGGCLAYGQPLPRLGKIALGVSWLEPAGSVNTAAEEVDQLRAREQTVALGYSQTVMPWLHGGIRIRAVRMTDDQHASAGEGIDLGVRVQFQSHWAGLTFYNLLPPHIRSEQEGVAYPQQLQLSLGSRWEKVLRVGLEWTQDLGQDTPKRVALGLESDFSKKWLVRTGMDTEAFYAGLGYETGDWGLDYGWRSNFATDTMHHRLGWHLRFGVYQIRLLQSSRYLTKDGVRPRIKISTEYDRSVLIKKWLLLIRNHQGQVVKYFSGQHRLPEAVTWEGRDHKSKMVPDGHYHCVMEGFDYEGNRIKSNTLSIVVASRQTPELIQIK